MKPPPFEYYNPRSLDEALSHLAEHGYDAKILAGGQSLVPMLNFRLAQPAVLVDLNKIADLAYIQAGNSGGIQVGTMTRHAQVERDPIIAERAPLIHETMPMIATSQIRSRGTFGGSIAHADPSAELVAISVALEGKFRLRSQSGPSVPPGTGWAIEEIARRPHDFALVGVAVVVTLHSDQRIQNARIVFLSVGDGPVVAEKAAESLRDQAPSPDLLRAAAEIAAAEDIDPSNDIHASADYRRHLAKVLTRQALETAIERAKG
jgi:carbon-monoxide dehydrogenase medium subunit